jgi:hypothetical protein
MTPETPIRQGAEIHHRHEKVASVLPSKPHLIPSHNHLGIYG